MKLTVTLPFFALLLVACSDGNDAKMGASAHNNCTGDDISLTGAWMRPVRRGQPTSAAYVTICNGTDSEIVLTGASFTGAKATELHITSMSDDNTASMTHSTELAIAASSSMTMEPGHTHIMLIGLKDSFAPGDAPHMTLEFKDMRPITAHLDVRDNAHDDQPHH